MKMDSGSIIGKRIGNVNHYVRLVLLDLVLGKLLDIEPRVSPQSASRVGPGNTPLAVIIDLGTPSGLRTVSAIFKEYLTIISITPVPLADKHTSTILPVSGHSS